MTNDSSTGGFLQPAPLPPVDWSGVARGWSEGLWGDVPPLEGSKLQRFLQMILVGITGLRGDKFFPRWQAEPPNLPNGDWAAFGITRRVATGWPYIGHDESGVDRMQRHELLTCSCSFYGPEADAYASALREGLTLPQNNEPFALMGFGLTSITDILTLPSLVKQRWLNRFDIDFTVMREINRTYPVLNLDKFLLRVHTDSNFTVSATTPLLV